MALQEQYRRCSQRSKKGILVEHILVNDHHSKTPIKLLNRESNRLSEAIHSMPLIAYWTRSQRSSE